LLLNVEVLAVFLIFLFEESSPYIESATERKWTEIPADEEMPNVVAGQVLQLYFL